MDTPTPLTVLRLGEPDLSIIAALVRRLEASPARRQTRYGPEKISTADAVRDALRLAARVYHLDVPLPAAAETGNGQS